MKLELDEYKAKLGSMVPRELLDAALKRLHTLQLKVVGKLRSCCLARALHTWIEGCPLKNLLHIGLKIGLRWKNLALSSAFRLWDERAYENRRRSAILRKAVGRMRFRLVAAAMAEWSDATLENKRRERIGRKVILRLKNKIMSNPRPTTEIETRRLWKRLEGQKN